MYPSFNAKNIRVLEFITSTKGLKGFECFVCSELCNRFKDGTCDEDRCQFHKAYVKKMAETRLLEEQTAIKENKVKIKLKDRLVVSKPRANTAAFYKAVKHSVSCAQKREHDTTTLDILSKVYKFAEKKNKQMTIYYINKSGLDCLRAIVNKHNEVKV